ncbi:adenylate/guanylate cyclase domain-containing protein [Neolewinella litorea]|uniref:Adenylate/guanylate cyclase domain-containing protein n=1 Tax=Neolewinella litorea TaxID=2562452 RepID=A0A4S4NJU3_9BACT|nr:adenylate/guanylate cyclase domain-containing protein [Neolewinella litorea]THH40049.1 adenylate/guanylate cyclase domain-containing protein [Neolewinella litorea]
MAMLPLAAPHQWLNRLILLLCLLTLAPAAPACFGQSAYDGQIQAIESMIDQGKFKLARTQSRALTESGRQQRLSNVEAYGNYLYGRALLEDPASSSRDRVAGIESLRLASAGFSDAGMTSTVDSIIAQLRDIVEQEGSTVQGLPLLREFRPSAPAPSPDNSDDVDETALTAIVALQNREIEALNDSQLRQLLRIQQQDLALDSFKYELLNDSLRIVRQEFLLKQQESLTSEERQRRNFFIVLALGILVALALLYLRYRSAQRFQQRIQVAQERSDELLLNILPRKIATELKETGRATARRYDSASVLFSDFVGFSRIASQREPEELVEVLDRTFRAFDEIIERHGLEKIKTIGDAYMCVGGVPEEDPDHAAKTVRAALEIQRYLSEAGDFQARIGIHTGPVVAGVVGQKKFAFDIWGDTVNQAARLEAAGVPGEVTISKATRNLLDSRFECERIGTFEAKNMGLLDRYRVLDSRLIKNPS